jgi:hypothetical protein
VTSDSSIIGPSLFGENHERAIRAQVEELDATPGVTDVRVNQPQVDVDGNMLDANRPDVQWNEDAIHHNVEFDTDPRAAERHRIRIELNDPRSSNQFIPVAPN